MSGWAVGGITFAGTLLILIGAFQAIAGLVAIFNDEFFVVARNYTFDLDVTGWRWVHLILGVLQWWSDSRSSRGRRGAGVVAITLAGLSALANFFFIPYYPFWSILEIALAVWVLSGR